MSRLWIVLLLLVVVWLFGPTRASVGQLPGVASWRVDPRHLPDPATTSPAGIASYFAGLTADQALALAREYPGVVGNLDGAPLALRYAVNGFGGRQIMALDRRGDGRIVEVLGDLAAAERVVVLIPGVDNTLADFDTGLGGVRRRAPAWQARQLFQRVGEKVAVIAWLGYDPPEGIRRAALREDRAAAGALALRRFVDGLVVDRPDRRIVVVGHSYGSVVAGRAAARLPAQVTDIVALGSPGLGVATRAQLGGAARVWAGSAPDDWTRKLPAIRVFGLGHGRSPVDPRFGALPLPAGDVTGHDGYFLSDTSTLAAIAQLATSRDGEIPRGASAMTSTAGSWISSRSPSSPGNAIVS
ncbi:alpha/beta hydrolase [Actinoplanes siamensis]|uniref:alpha/beta hydrolase n=1 Tax=Actinoplanes siamensis TaxID=1223317 RepID=UPI0019456747|nr:alpha/beta hydrolase [Actinoplanes siamensis]